MALQSRAETETDTKTTNETPETNQTNQTTKDVMEHIDLLSIQREGLVEREKLVVRNIARLKLPLGPVKKSYHHKYELEDLESEHRNIRKETDRVDKLIGMEFESGARAMRFNMRCIGPSSKTGTEKRNESAQLEAA